MINNAARIARQTLNKYSGLSANPPLAAVIAFLAVLAISAAYMWREHVDDLREHELMASEIMSHYTHSMERQIGYMLASLNSLAYIARADNGEIGDFTLTAARLGLIYPEVSELYLITRDNSGGVRPPLSYRNTDIVNRCLALERLIRNPFMALVSPNLGSDAAICEDGNVAIVGYLPVFSGHTHTAGISTSASAVAIAVLFMRDIAESAGLLHLAALGYDYELIHIDDDGRHHRVMAGSNRPQQPLIRQFSTSDQVWELRVAPAGGWISDGTIAKRVFFMISLGVFAAALANMLARLALAQVTLRASEQRFRDLAELSSDWWWEQDETLRYVAFSSARTYAGLTANDHLGRTRWELPHTALPRNESWDKHIEMLHRHEPFRNLIIERRLPGETRRLKVSGKPLFSSDGRFIGYRGSTVDVTDESNAQLAVRESEANFRGIFNVVPDPLIVRDDADRIRQVNPAACKFFGARHPQELIGKNWFELYPPEEKEIALRRSRLLVRPQTPIPVAKRKFLRLDGSIITGEITGLMLSKREGRQVLTVIHDSSEREAVAQQYEMLQRELTRRVIATREHERRTLSNELHDRVGQTLTAARFNLDFLYAQIPENVRPLIDDTLTTVHGLLQAMSAHVKDLMAELHPPALDDHGLRTALAFHLDNIAQRSGIHVEIHGQDFKPWLPQDKELMLFRIAQEALHNVLKHAQCTKVLVSLFRDGKQFGMTIADNGIGFDPALVTSNKFGLRIMRERAESIGARLEIRQEHRLGTQIIVTLDRADIDYRLM